MRINAAWNQRDPSLNVSDGVTTISVPTNLTVDMLDEASVMPQPIGLVLLVYGRISGVRAWREVFNSRESDMRAGEEWFKARDIVPWD